MERMQSNHNNPINCELHFKNNEDIIFTKAQGLYSENNNTYIITLVDISDLRQTESNTRREQELLAKTEQLAKTGSGRQDIAS